MNSRILVVDDEPANRFLLENVLLEYQVTSAASGEEMWEKIDACDPGLILMDVMLPGKDGLEIARELRAFSQVPLIMVTARVEEIDRLLGLELGADDYVCKPFSFREVVARVKAVLRRTRKDENSPPDKAVILDRSMYRAEILGKSLDLTAIEFNLLETMAKSPGRIFSRDKLMDVIYPDGRVVSDRTIDSHVSKLRRKIQDLIPDREILVSVYSVGYKFEPPAVD